VDEIVPGREVRFRRCERGHWHPGVITGTADRGTAIWVRDGFTGASRCLRIDDVEVAMVGPKGGKVWVTVATASTLPVQTSLL